MDDSIFYLKKEVCAVTRLSPAQIDRLERDGKFPRRQNLTGKLNGKAVWIKSDVQDWCHARTTRMLKPPSDSLVQSHPPLQDRKGSAALTEQGRLSVCTTWPPFPCVGTHLTTHSACVLE